MNDRNESSENSESIVKWITVTILIAISVFFAILYQNTTEMPTGEAAKEVIDEIKEDPLEEPTEEDTPAEDPYVAPVITYTTFPKSAFTSSTGEYYINTGGENDEYLQEVIDFNGYYYLILETNSNGNDYNADRAGVAVAKIDYNGTIIKTVTLVGGRNETYLSSKISGMGIVIAALGTSGINYYLVSFELEYSKSVTSDIFDSIKMYYTRDYTLIAGTTGKNITIF